MLFDSLFGGAQLNRNLFVEQAGADQREDFALARREPLLAELQFVDFSGSRLEIVAAPHCARDRLQEHGAGDRLFQKVRGAAFHCLDGIRNIGISSNEHHR